MDSDSDSDSERSDGGTGGGVTMLEHAGGQEVAASSLPPPSCGEAFVQGRECAWCATPFVVVRRPGRPRLYCAHACRQRAYEHRHGLEHRRTVRALPGQAVGDEWRGSGYERGGWALVGSKTHALRHSVRPEGRRRETLCGALAAPIYGQHFHPFAATACAACAAIVAATPLEVGISPSNELSRLRAVIVEVAEQRLPPSAAFAWLVTSLAPFTQRAA